MPGGGDELVLEHHDGEAAQLLLDELADVYADAYGVEPTEEKTAAFQKRAAKAVTRAGFDLVTARAEGQLVAFAFGAPLPARDTYWWGGLRPEPPASFADEDGRRTFVLSEIEVRRAWQGSGVGRRIHDALLARRTEQRATLAANPKATETQALYERWTWRKVGQVPGASGDYYDAYDLFVLPLTAEEGRR